MTESHTPKNSDFRHEILAGPVPQSILAEWRDFLASCPRSHVLQTPEWYQLNQDAASRAAFTYRNGKMCAASTIRVRAFPTGLLNEWLVRRGPVAADSEALTAHLGAIRESVSAGTAWIRISPLAFGSDVSDYDQALDRAGWLLMQPADDYSSTVTIDLRAPLADIKSGLRRSLRPIINKPDKHDVVIRPARSSADTHLVIEQLNKQARERGLSAVPQPFANALVDGVHKPGYDFRCLVAEHQEKIVAGIVLICLADRVTYQWGYSSTDPDHRRLPMTHLLHWAGINQTKEDGYACYDMGGYWDAKGDADPINRFKLAFTKAVAQVPRERYLPCKPLVARGLFAVRGAIARRRERAAAGAEAAATDSKEIEP